MHFKFYINLFVIMSNLNFINQYIDEYGNDLNKQALVNLFEIYLLYGATNTYSGAFSKVIIKLLIFMLFI